MPVIGLPPDIAPRIDFQSIGFTLAAFTRDPDLTRAGVRIGGVRPPQNLGPAVLVELQCSHRRSPPPRARPASPPSVPATLVVAAVASARPPALSLEHMFE